MNINDLAHQIENILVRPVESIQPISGGSINQTFLLNCSDGRFFAKFNSSSQSLQMFEAEQEGLNALAASGCIHTPKVLACQQLSKGSVLVLEFIESGQKTNAFWESFGHALAQLHRQPGEYFGWGRHNYIGSLPQYNTPALDWPDFFRHQRLGPQLEMATQSQKLGVHIHRQFESLYGLLGQLCPLEPPAMTHGDLWSGNFMADVQSCPVLFDPAVSYAHREMDLAMSRLFGGFDHRFYAAYEEAYPLAPGFEERLPVYQLYYLLVHVNLFGGSYIRQLESILNRYT